MTFLKDINWDGSTFGYDLLMINDQKRNKFFTIDPAICRDAVVLDIGTGTGILSVSAVQSGAKKVYSFEKDPKNYAVAKQFIKQAGLEDKIELICSDILSVDKNSWHHLSIDIVTTETFANDCFIENFACFVDHVYKHFNTNKNIRWIPEQIDLMISFIDCKFVDEFVPGIDLPETYTKQINNAINLYRNKLYHAHDQINMNVAQVTKSKPEYHKTLDKFVVGPDLKSQIDNAKYFFEFDFAEYQHPYIKIDWVLYKPDNELWLNCCESWRSIAFQVNKSKGNKFYFRFNSLSHELIGTQL